MPKDINLRKEFSEWTMKTFDWVDTDLKNYMFRAWCAGLKEKRKQDKDI